MNNDLYIMRDPTAELSPVIRRRIDPPQNLNGATIGLLSISKERSDEFLDTVAKRLTEQGHQIVRFKKPTHTKPAPEAVLQDIVSQCTVVIEGLAD